MSLWLAARVSDPSSAFITGGEFDGQPLALSPTKHVAELADYFGDAPLETDMSFRFRHYHRSGWG
jgi:hypothetical protein